MRVDLYIVKGERKLNNSSKITILCLIILSVLLVSFFVIQIQNQNSNVETLEEQVKNLYQENVELKENEDYLRKQIDSIKLENDKNTKRVEELIKEKEELEEKVDDLEKEKQQLIKDLQAKNSGGSKGNSNNSNSGGNNKDKVVTSNPHVIQGDTPSKEKIAFLTFDDGPSKNTEQILDILKDYGIKATFYVNGTKSTDIYKRIVNEGHAIGNHTYSHDYSKIYKSVDAFFEDFYKLENVIYEATGVKPKVVRLPGGSNNQVSWKHGGKGLMSEITKELVKRGYSYFDWNVDSADASTGVLAKDKIVKNVVNGCKGKNTVNILMHSSAAKTTTVEALPEIIEQLTEMGFRFEITKPNSFAPRFL